jgi:hypothetical protein
MGNEGYWIQANEEFCGTRGCNSSTGMCNPDPLANDDPTFLSGFINNIVLLNGEKNCDGKTLLICSNEQQAVIMVIFLGSLLDIVNMAAIQ